MAKKFDVIIIGGGPGGYVAAIRASQLGLKVGLVEKEHLGGICLNWGCIPTKALLRCSDIYHTMHHLDDFGLSANNLSFDLAKIVERSRNVSKQLASGVAFLMKKNKVEVIDGFGKLEGAGKVSVTKDGVKVDDLEAKHIIVATGARARQIPGMEADEKLIWTYRKAMTPDIMPKSLVVIGSGAIGLEFASFYRNMGAEVTVIEMANRIMPVEDEEIAKLARKAFEKQGMIIHTEAALKSIKKNADSITATFELKGKAQEINADRIIMAVGVVPNTENIGLEKTKVKMERGIISVNQWLETDEKGIYAIGDVVAGPWLAHKASHEGVICVEKIAEKEGKYKAKDTHPLNRLNVPGCTYTMPQVASVGLTEAKALEQGYKIKVGRFQNQGNGKAIAMGETSGMIKTIFDEKTGELLGAHMIGAEVTEMLQGFLVGKSSELTELDFMHTIFPHPTLSEMMHESVLDAFGKCLHA